jgi:hypothetical protein
MGVAPRLWRVLDAVDYWVMHARPWRVDALYGPEPETEANRQRGCESGALAVLGSPPAARIVRLVSNASRSPLSTPGTATRNIPAFARVSGRPTATRSATAAATAPSPQRRWRLTEPLRASLIWGTGQERQRRGMLPLYTARIEDLGVGDFVKIDCADDYGRVLNIRSSLLVKISHAASVEETFSTVMGDLVEPSRDFIQANALSVANLDV